jgi:hypothetical protein
MDADDYMRAPPFKQSGYVANTSSMKEFAGLGPDSINAPVEVFHPVLAISQNPIVESNKFGGKVMRFFDSSHNSDSNRLTLEKLLHACNYRRRG